LFIGSFIAYTAVREYRWVKTEHLLASHVVGEVYLKNHFALSLGDGLQKAFDVFEKTGQQGFLVFDGTDDPIGTLDLGEMIGSSPPIGQVKDYYKNGFGEISMSATLKEANEIIQHRGQGVLAVKESGGIVGVLEEEMIWKYLLE
jgi:predicted transcriptional regulator